MESTGTLFTTNCGLDCPSVHCKGEFRFFDNGVNKHHQIVLDIFIPRQFKLYPRLLFLCSYVFHVAPLSTGTDIIATARP